MKLLLLPQYFYVLQHLHIRCVLLLLFIATHARNRDNIPITAPVQNSSVHFVWSHNFVLR